ncbi:GNAT family N-acetyltransferase [Intestinimonas sp. HCP28S3_D6]|uniref:GNAT family N-acetyltransferase n=1 Tax=Intestinimonas sp. HCP28S3_D6 TaxID=3438942 RepID=UPI003F88F719
MEGENRLELVRPDERWAAEVWDYKAEFEARGDHLDGTADLGAAADFSHWLSDLRADDSPNTVRPGRVPADTFLAVRRSDRRLVGMVNIRHTLNDYLFQFGGHIGYSVRSSERRKGYAKEMLALALDKCKGLKLDHVLVTCDSENEASARTIRANGGVLENRVPEGEGFTDRYWIEVGV